MELYGTHGNLPYRTCRMPVRNFVEPTKSNSMKPGPTGLFTAVIDFSRIVKSTVWDGTVRMAPLWQFSGVGT